MSAEPSARPNAAAVLILDAGISVPAALLVMPLLIVALGGWLAGQSAAIRERPGDEAAHRVHVAGRPTEVFLAAPLSETQRAAALVSAAMFALTFVGSLVLTGPQSLIGRLAAFLLLCAAVPIGYAAESFLSGAVSGGQLAPLAAISAGFVMVLFSAGWLVRCLGAGRSLQFGAAALLGLLLTGNVWLIEPALRNIPDPADRRTAVEWFFRTNPTVAGWETVGWRDWLNPPGSFYKNGGETVLETLGTASSTGASGGMPIWMKSAPALFAAGTGLFAPALAVAWWRNRLARKYRPAD
mgnify:CR=1 FL=1